MTKHLTTFELLIYRVCYSLEDESQVLNYALTLGTVPLNFGGLVAKLWGWHSAALAPLIYLK